MRVSTMSLVSAVVKRFPSLASCIGLHRQERLARRSTQQQRQASPIKKGRTGEAKQPKEHHALPQHEPCLPRLWLLLLNALACLALLSTHFD